MSPFDDQLDHQPTDAVVPVDNAPGPGHQLRAGEADGRLLAGPQGGQDPSRNAWWLMRVQGEFANAMEELDDLGPAIGIFGSARTPADSPVWASAHRMAQSLAGKGFAVITGAGPGVMEAANLGARRAGGRSVGLGIELPFETSMNPGVTMGISFRHFFTRKVMFLRSSQGFIVMPGGLGTFDELFEALTLVQTGKVAHFPVVLFGSAYWGGLVDWLRDIALAQGTISAADLDLFLVTDDEEQAVAHVTGATAG